MDADYSLLRRDISAYVASLQKGEGRFSFARSGFTGCGESSLGASCLALKIYYTLGMWQELSQREQESWIAHINSFQSHQAPYPFLDLAILDCREEENVREKALFWVKRHFFITREDVIRAETKQAIATLAQVKRSPQSAFSEFPQTKEGVRHFLSKLNWKKPWSAGGQTAALAVFLSTQAPAVVGEDKARELEREVEIFLQTLSDPPTGAYFKSGNKPEHGELINGAMKILNALEWLKVPIHYPERLIDTCLLRLPEGEGCHLVDSVYVLHQCLKQVRYREEDVKKYCGEVLELIMRHKHNDGGFSYFIGSAQRRYYGARISKGLQESDLHGTCLLTWALAMIDEMTNKNSGWKVIKA